MAGMVLVLASLILIAGTHERGPGAVYYRLGAAGVMGCLATAVALQAVDGIALRSAVNAWSAAPAATKTAAFYAAFAIRQIEVGIASVLNILLGVAAALYGLAMLREDSFPKWVAALAEVGGIGTAIAGIVMAYSGFSDLEMMISMPANSVLMLWMLIMGVLIWRSGE